MAIRHLVYSRSRLSRSCAFSCADFWRIHALVLAWPMYVVSFVAVNIPYRSTRTIFPFPIGCRNAASPVLLILITCGSPSRVCFRVAVLLPPPVNPRNYLGVSILGDLGIIGGVGV
jgi:hypothetical protein